MCPAKRVQHDMLGERYGREGEVCWKQQTSSERADKAILGCFLPVYDEVDVFYCKRIQYVSSMCVGTHSGVLNSIELHAVQKGTLDSLSHH